jgi:hypothetical protein
VGHASAPVLAGRHSPRSESVTKWYDRGEYAGEVIKRSVQAASGYTFGIDENRVAYLRPDGRSATTATYYEQADGTLTDASGGEVKLWHVRPDVILRHVDFAPANVNPTAAIDGIESVYLSEVTFRMPYELQYRTAVAGPLGEVE